MITIPEALLAIVGLFAGATLVGAGMLLTGAGAFVAIVENMRRPLPVQHKPRLRLIAGGKA
jgi:hypothetical protein